MKNLIIIVIICIFVTSCTSDTPPTASELLRTGEYYTAEEMESLKSQAVNVQSAQAGIGQFAEIVAIDFDDESEQVIYISVDNKTTYEKLQITKPDKTKVRIIVASSGGGSGEIILAFKFTSDDSEWIETFYTFAYENMKWENVTEFQNAYLPNLNEIPPEELQFK